VNPKAIYAAGAGIAAAALAIFFILGPGNIRLPGMQENNSSFQLANLTIALKEVSAERLDEKNANVVVAFTVHNPNRSAAILETIHYSLFVDQFQMTSGDIGESPEGFVASQAGTFTIVSNSTTTLSDSTVVGRNNLTASAWDSMINETAQYRVEGNYMYRITGANFETTPGEMPFNLNFP
jgi:LEA14-like dessication related protein